MKIKAGIIPGFIIIITILIAAGCTRKIYIPTESVHYSRDTIKSIVYRIDSIYQRDSVFISSAGDTVIKERYQWRIREKAIHDTIYKIRQDSARVTITKEPASTSKTRSSVIEKIVSRTAWIISAAIIILILATILKKVIKK